jgi:hypothetical protein
MWSGSLENNRIGTAGAAAIGAGLTHLPQLRALEYVVCPAVCAGLWCAVSRKRDAMACMCGYVVVCVVCVFVQA